MRDYLWQTGWSRLLADFLIMNKWPFLFYDGKKGGVVCTALTFFDCMMARVQVPMAAVEFVVGYHDLVLSLVGWSIYHRTRLPWISLRATFRLLELAPMPQGGRRWFRAPIILSSNAHYAGYAGYTLEQVFCGETMYIFTYKHFYWKLRYFF